ncbi:LCP family protein [Serpentinicella alkaliphila]|uniref:LytR family transcriptional attenuator n=1 Tax=Serpentinicella alkaliphila TaxID=1734049 RepID=A0A4V2T326_9FIRM|nr:LCP family protein [Serpentinicella alkaliphila]QUH25493.1 LCP family protein [Serpentinicella alkaliphila]TCP99673.1 LytR family transcriptional attenuator [Serpentinicella alkaliphila]
MKRWKLWTSVVLGVVMLLVLGGSYNLYRNYKSMLKNISVMEEENGQIEDQKKDVIEPFAMLTYGISARKHLNDPGHSDTMMLALVDPQEVKITLISIPRDAYVEIPGYRTDKINSTYPRGGPKLMISTIENWLDVDVHAYTSINFQGFIDLIDLVGGIDVNVPRRMVYSDPYDGTRVRLEPGEQILDGKNALDFVRFRKSNDGRHDSDYARMERQQEALKALSNKITSIRSIPRILNMMNILSDNVETSLTPKELEQLIRIFITFRPESLETHSIIGGGHYINNGWYEIVTEEEVERINTIINDFFSKSNDI